MIGHHEIYKVEDTAMIYIPSSGLPTNTDEQRYSRLFQVSLNRSSIFGFLY
jgi:hypothetical protein